jgi:hypothetical protein
MLLDACGCVLLTDMLSLYCTYTVYDAEYDIRYERFLRAKDKELYKENSYRADNSKVIIVYMIDIYY